MSEGLVLMSGKEADRLGLVRDVVEGRIRCSTDFFRLRRVLSVWLCAA